MGRSMSADEFPDVHTEDSFHRYRVRSDHVHGDIPCPKRRRYLEADEARADYYCLLRDRGLGDQSHAVGERAQIVDMR